MQIMLSLSVALLAGLGLTRLVRLFKLPDVTAYLIAGILVGPYVLGALGVPGDRKSTRLNSSHAF